MISSRRLAREWALKILYQIDVGKLPSDESTGAMEHLRMEFVRRGPHAGPDRVAEETCLNCVTRGLVCLLPVLSPALEREIAPGIARLVAELPGQQDRLLERAVGSKSKSGSRSDIPKSMPYTLGSDEGAARTLGPALEEIRDDLLRTFEPSQKVVAKALSKEWAAAVSTMSPVDAVAYRTAGRASRLREEEERAVRISAVVQKQSADWLRTAGFVRRLVVGTLGEMPSIDERLGGLSEDWKMTRQAAVDRNILRLAAYEMLYVPGIPAAASINEAVELAKKYSTAESGRFVNGVLGTLATQIDDADEKPASEEPPEDAMTDLPEVDDVEDTP